MSLLVGGLEADEDDIPSVERGGLEETGHKVRRNDKYIAIVEE
jgi:hypothetical protein